jgi:general secretion pathway protein A
MPQEHANMPHLDALGLDFNPFPVVPDAHNYFTTEGMNTAISDIMHCIEARKGFILISGEVGLGKTTLSRLLLLKLAINNVNTALVLNTFLQSGSLLKAINKDFNVHIESNLIEDQLDALNNFLLEQYAHDRNCVIVIDDAQQLNLESLELVRQLSNLETNQNKLVQIILVAQGEILTTLTRHDMRQLKSRIALNIKIEALTVDELKQYIQFRLARAGSSGQIELEPKAYKYLHKVTQGLPRQINLVMDRCLYVVAAYGINKIDKELINKAYKEICIDTYSEKVPVSKKTKWLALAAVIITAIGITVFQFKDYFHINLLENGFNNVISQEDLKQKIQKTATVPVLDDEKVKNNKIVSLANVKQKFTLEKTQAPKQDTNPVTQSETEFLNQFGLLQFEKQFKQSLESNDFTQLARSLEESSEYKILLGHGKSEFVDNKKLWPLKDASQWLTFWKPQLVLNAFYQGYYSENILVLQSLLKDEGYYLSKIDGIVGERTIVAISKLQTEMGLTPSGFPDEMTLYQLQNRVQNISETGGHINQIEHIKKNKIPNKNESNRYALDNSIITD